MLAKGYKPAGLHQYTDAAGSRSITGSGRSTRRRARSGYAPYTKTVEGYELGEPVVPEGKKPLYRLQELAARPGAPVWCVEGENCADALVKLGVLATTCG